MTKNKVMFIVIVLSVMAVLLSIGLAVVFVAMDTKLGSSISIQYLPGNYIRYDVTNIANASEFVGRSVDAGAFTTTTAIPQYKGENANSTTGYMFAGWYTDEELTNEYIEGSTLTTATTLYPKFVAGTVDVSNMTKTADGYVINNVTSSNVVASVVGARQEILNKQSTIKAPATISGLIIPDYIKEGDEYIPVVGINAQWKSSTSGAKLYIGNNIKSMPNDFALNNTNLTESYIGSGITEVTWHSMFESCTSLAKVEFSYHSKLAYIGLDMFRSCHGLKTIRLKGTDASAVNTIPSTVTVIGSGGFAGCRNAAMTALQLPDGITAFGNQAFYNCQYLASLNMPSSLETIGSETFSNCRYLANVVIPNTVTTIGQKSFTTCVRLKTVKLPSEVETLDTSMFEGCTALTTVTFDANSKLSVVKDRVFFGCTKLTTLVNGATTDYTLPASVTTIGDSTFSGCTALTTFVMPTRVTTIANNLFEGCTVFTGSGESSARSLDISNITSIGTAAFKGCDALKTVTLSSSLTEMGASAFESCEKLLNINLKDVSLTSIPERAFYDCNALRTARFPYSVKTIGKEAFAECNWLTYLWYYPSADGLRNSGITTIEEGAFYNSPTINRFDSINNQYISGTTNIVEFFSEAGFTYNYYHINIPTSVITIGANAFNKVGAGYYNSASQRILIDGEIDLKNADGKSTIYGSHGIEMSVRIPNTNITIAANAFGNNPRIKYVSFGDRLINGYDIGSGDQKVTISTYLDVFSTCQYLDTLVFSDTYTEKTSATTSTTYPGVTIIPSHKFSWNETIRKIVFPESLETIAAEAFNRCSNLTDISSLGSCYNLVEILDRTFYHCYGIVDLYLPYSLEILNTSAFSHCTNLENVYLFNDNDSSNDEVALNKLGSYAFYNCAKLKSMTLVNEACSSIAKQSDWSDTTVQHVETCDCNNFAVVKRDGGTTNLINTSNRFNVSDSVFESADEITAAIASFKKKYELYLNFGSLIADGCVELVPDRDGYDDYESAFKSAQEFINQSYNPVVKNMDLFKENSATILVNKGLSVTLSLQEPDSSMKYDEYDTLLAMAAKLFGCASVSEFTSTATTLSNYYKNKSLASGATVLDRLKYDGAIHTTNGSFLFPYLVESNFSEAFCMLLIIDPSGLVFVIVSDAYEAFKAVNYQYMMHDTEASDIRLTGLCGTMVKEDDIVYIPDSVTILGGQAFYCNTALTQVRLSNNINALYGTPFYGCSSLTNTIVGTGIWDNENLADGAPSQTYDWNYAFKDTMSDNITVTIEEGVTTIPKQAMIRQNMHKLVLPSTLVAGQQTIGEQSFYECKNLTDVDFSKATNLTQIYTQAFMNCSSLKSLTFPANISILSTASFAYCTSLKNVTFTGSALTIISVKVFKGCSSLESINLDVCTSVNTINEEAFIDCEKLQRINITSTALKTLGKKAFYGCRALESVSIPSNAVLTSIPEATFAGCTSLTSCNIPSKVTSIGVQAFYNCKVLPAISIPSGVTTIGNEAFRYCLGAESLSMPATVKTLGTYVFSDCTSLAVVSIPSASQLTAISNYTFYNCHALASISIPASVKSIGACAFYSCSRLAAVTFEGSSLVTSIGQSAFYRCETLPSITIPSGVTTIGNEAFRYCTSLESASLSATVKTLGTYVFSDCTSLTTVSIPSTSQLTAISNYTFNNCTSLDSITLPASITKIGDYSFCRCEALGDITIPSGVTTIGICAFRYCTSLESVSLSATVKTFGTYVFSDCTSLTTVSIPSTSQLTAISDNAFYNCTSLDSITLPSSITKIGNYAFSYCEALSYINIPNNVTTLGKNALSSCKSLTQITIPATVTSIGRGVLSICSKLTSIIIDDNNPKYSDGDCNVIIDTTTSTLIATANDYIIPSSVTTLGEFVFYGVSEFTELIIPDNITSIEDSAFYNAYRLKKLTIPASVTSIGVSAFGACMGVDSIIVDDNNPKYSDGNGSNVIIDTDTNTLIAGCKNSTIPSGVTSIGEQAFYFQNHLTEIIIPASVTSIGTNAFHYCTELAAVTFESGSQLVSIGQKAFNQCLALTEITIPASVTSIDDAAFVHCRLLETVTFETGSRLISIGYNAFYNCTSLTEIIIPASVTSIGISAFNNCTSLTEIIIPASVTSISSSAFSNCSNLTIVTFETGSQLTSIGYSAFNNCTSLTEIIIPTSVTYLGNEIFSGCTTLTSVIFENTTGWFYTTASNATSGTDISVSDAAINAQNFQNIWKKYYLKRN